MSLINDLNKKIERGNFLISHERSPFVRMVLQTRVSELREERSKWQKIGEPGPLTEIVGLLIGVVLVASFGGDPDDIIKASHSNRL